MTTETSMNQPAYDPLPAHGEYLRTSTHQCPWCTAYLVRMPRRPVDRLWSIVKPARRYRCERFACQWQGNLPVLAAKEGAAGDDQSGAVQRTIPTAFVAHILLAVVGAILVVVIGSSEPPMLP